MTSPLLYQTRQVLSTLLGCCAASACQFFHVIGLVQDDLHEALIDLQSLVVSLLARYLFPADNIVLIRFVDQVNISDDVLFDHQPQLPKSRRERFVTQYIDPDGNAQPDRIQGAGPSRTTIVEGGIMIDFCNDRQRAYQARQNNIRQPRQSACGGE